MGGLQRLVTTHDRQEGGDAGAGRELTATELLIGLNARLTVSKNAGLSDGLDKIRAEVLSSHRSHVVWEPRNLALKKPETQNLSPCVM